MVLESKLTLALLAALLGWRDPQPPDFWTGLGHAEVRVFHAALRSAIVGLDEHDLDAALFSATRAAEAMPNRFEGHLVLALAREERGLAGAAESFARALALERRWATIPIAADYASSAFARAGDFTRAAEVACTCARTAEPSDMRSRLFERCGASLMTTGPSGLEAAKRALDLGASDGPSPSSLLLLALVTDRGGAHDLALAMLRSTAHRALEEHAADSVVGTSEDVAMARGLLAESIGRTQEAIAAYELATARGPWAEHARAAIGSLLTRTSSPTIVPPPNPRRR